jgi:hypothetical protein
MFDSIKGQVMTLEDGASVANRTSLLVQTDPTELYNSVDFGVGIRKWLFQYNVPEIVIPQIEQRLREQLIKYEPYSIPEKSTVSPGLEVTEADVDPYSFLAQTVDPNHLKITMKIPMINNEEAEMNF